MKLTVPLVLITLSSAIVATPSNGQTDAKPVATKERIEKLIESLASKHEPPTPDSRVLTKEEKSIWKAVDELMIIGIEALPALIDHFDDERFSFTESNVSGSRLDNPVLHQTVGRLCYRIVTAQVQKYVSWSGPDPRDSPGYRSTVVPTKKEEAVKWINERMEKALWELQKENLSLVITQNEELLAKIEKGSNDHQLCKMAIKKNSELIAKLERTKKPLPSTSPRPWYDR